MRVLFLGDIIGRVGRRNLKYALPGLKSELNVDLCIGNAENAAAMFGVTKKVADEIIESGVDIMTSGNHIWDKREGIQLLDTREDILRPANYPPDAPGRGLVIREVRGRKVAVINLQGRTFMPSIDCPFRSADAILSRFPADLKLILVDFHAEATSEKLAMGFYLDGRVSAVAGTHTHVPTSDERILRQGTAYMTDIGMVGAFNSIIGARKEEVLNRFLYSLPVRFHVADEQPCIEGLFVELDEETGRAMSVLRVKEEIREVLD